MPLIAFPRPRTAALLAVLALCSAVAWRPARAQEAPPREMIAVLDLEPVGATPVEASAMSDRLREELLRSGRFSLIERERLESVLEEQTLQQVSCVGQECAVQVGRVLGVAKIVTGRATKLGANSWQISAQLIDVQTAETLAAESVIHEGRLVDLLQQSVPALAAKLAGREAAAPPPTAPVPAPRVEAVAPPPAAAAAEEPEPPPADAPVARVFLSPLTAFAMTLNLTYPGETLTVSIGGVGISLGVDLFVAREFTLWAASHLGAVTSVSAQVDGVSETFENVEGSMASVALGADAVVDSHPWRFLVGGGLFTSSTQFTVDSVDSDATLSGILLDLRVDYTFDGGFFLGAGLDVGFGAAGGTLTEGADSATGTLVLLYFPLGFSF